MFIVHHKKNTTSIIEVEVEKISPIEDASVSWLKNEEYYARIIKPEHYESLKNLVWFSACFFHSEEEARRQAEKDIKIDMDRVIEKSGKEFDTEVYNEKCKEIKVIRL